MKAKLLGEKVLVIPDNSDERTTPGGIIIPKTVKDDNSELKSGIVLRKGTGTPWNDMSDIKIKDRVYFRKGAGKPHTEDGAEYLIISCNELIAV